MYLSERNFASIQDTRVRIYTSSPLKHMLTLHKLGNMTKLKGA